MRKCCAGLGSDGLSRRRGLSRPSLLEQRGDRQQRRGGRPHRPAFDGRTFMTPRELIELAIAAVLLGVGIWLYRRPQSDDSAPDGGPATYGNQGAVLLIIIAIILAIHGSGLLRYQPNPVELEAMRGQ